MSSLLPVSTDIQRKLSQAEKKYKNFLHAQHLTISIALSKNSLDLFRTHEDRKNAVIQSPIGVATWRYCLNTLCIRILDANRTLEGSI